MRKILPFLIPLLLAASMLSAQQKQSSAKKQISNVKQQQQADAAILKMDPGLLQMVKREREQSKAGYMSLAKLNTNAGAQSNKRNDAAPVATGKTNAKVAVNITCKVTPEFVKIITDAGGVIVSSSKENGLVVANVPAASLQTIAASSYVEQISPAQSPEPGAVKAEKVNPVVSSNTSRNSTMNIMSESVQKYRKQAQSVKQAAN